MELQPPRRKRDGIDPAVAEFGGEIGVTLLSEFPPLAIAAGVVAGVGVLGFVAWKLLSRKNRR